MALVGINQPGYAPQVQGESTFDKVLKGLQVATQIGSLGVNIADSFTRSKQAQTDAKIAALKEAEMTATVAKSYVPTTETDPLAVPIELGGQKLFYKLREERLKPEDYISLADNGHGNILFEDQAQALSTQGGKAIGIGGGLFFAPDPGKAKLDLQKRLTDLAKTEAETEKIKAETKKTQKETSAEQPKVTAKTLTPGELQVDKEFAKDYNDFIAQGGYSDVDKNINQLKEVREKLKETNSATGPIIGTIPKALRNIITPEGASMQDAVEEVVQRNLRLVLGAQFTEKEGQRLIERAYNPSLSEEENLKRVNRLIDQIDKAAKAKKEASRYFEANGTLRGFKGKLIRSINDVVPAELSPTPSAKPKTVIQNGHTYHLNEQTGQYE